MLLVIGYWLLVIGYWLLVISHCCTKDKQRRTNNEGVPERSRRTISLSLPKGDFKRKKQPYPSCSTD